MSIAAALLSLAPMQAQTDDHIATFHTCTQGQPVREKTTSMDSYTLPTILKITNGLNVYHRN